MSIDHLDYAHSERDGEKSVKLYAMQKFTKDNW